MLSVQTDNAYLWLGVLVLLAPVGALLLVAAALPTAPRLWLWRAGTILLWLIGLIGVPLLGLGLAIVLAERYPTWDPLLWHAVGFFGLLATLYVVGFRPLRTAQGQVGSVQRKAGT